MASLLDYEHLYGLIGYRLGHSFSRDYFNHKFEEEGEIPASLKKLVDFDPVTSNFVDKTYPDIVIITIYDLLDARYARENENGEEAEA